MRKLENLPRHELIGLKTEVVESENTMEEGIRGRVVDERKNVLKVECKGEEKTVRKKGRKFKFELPSEEQCKIDGETIEGRPEDRIKKKMRKW